ncbi:hypothetical protein NDU88_002202 [Pleurodeles waltl]|uniref:Uncharacterized protein n=1 Tax=Pleurodeles waltl TaxID=8319 RepID=A0AAV7NGZ3_PLEWA|nr:hypothetical protein NDU88_002199 [Pleurodeles waltl]KAJ1113962.1 hypothetical protein NDU88_002202 [Pleurodeles waltl]
MSPLHHLIGESVPGPSGLRFTEAQRWWVPRRSDGREASAQGGKAPASLEQARQPGGYPDLLVGCRAIACGPVRVPLRLTGPALLKVPSLADQRRESPQAPPAPGPQSEIVSSAE